MASDESFKRPGSVPFKWEVQPGIPKQKEQQHKAAADALGTAPTAPRLALPPASRVGAVFAPASWRRRASSSSSSVVASAAALLSPPALNKAPSHRRSMSARFATSLARPFTRWGRGGGGGGRAKDDVDDFSGFSDFSLLYAEKIASSR